MMSELTDTTTRLPRNPFVPGFGRLPPYPGSHRAAERHLKDVRAMLTAEQPDVMGTFMYGPRGTGKTALLRRFRQTFRVRPEPTILLTLSASTVATEEGMRRALFRPTVEMTGQAEAKTETAAMPTSIDKAKQWVRGWLKQFSRPHFDLIRDIDSLQPKDLHLSVGVGSVTLALPEHPDRSEAESLLRLGGPVLITLDEAHMVAPDALRILLNAVQEAADRISVALVLAGTPDLKDVLRETRATYALRGKKLPIGRLKQEDAVAVIEHPLQDTDISVNRDAVQHLVQSASCYPFFLQLCGQEAFDAVQRSGTMHFGTDECRMATNMGETARTDHYAGLLDEFVEEGEPNIARHVALAFSQHGNNMTTMQLKRLLDGMDSSRTSERWRFLKHKGFIWEGTIGGT